MRAMLAGMPNESAAQARASRLRTDRRRCQDAAAVLRHRVNQGRYAGMRGPDEGYAVAALLEAGGIELDRLPRLTGRAVLALVGELLDDDPDTPGPVQPLTAGPGH